MGRTSLPVIRDLTRTIHYARYLKNRSGQSFAEIAESEKVSEKTVKESVKNFEVYQMMTAVEHVNHGLGSVVVEAIPLMRVAMNEALQATDEIEVKDKDGNKTTKIIPDHSTRNRAMETINEIAKTIQPKAPGPSTHVQVGVGVNGNGGIKASGSFVNMEARMRELREGIKAAPQLAGSEPGMLEGVAEEVAGD